MPLWQPTSGIARPAYYDRVPIVQNPVYNAVIAPAALTTRWAYTPPTGRAAFIEACFVLIVTITAAGVKVYSEGRVTIQPNAGTETPMMDVLNQSNVPQTPVDRQLQNFGYMAQGDTLRFETQSFDTGGTVAYIGSMKGTEFLY